MEKNPDSGNTQFEKGTQELRQGAERAADEAMGRAESAKSDLGSRAEHAASALGSVADELEAEGEQRIAAIVETFARNLGDLARQLENRSLDQLLRDGSGLAQRNPLLFVAGSVAAGVMLSRFFKAQSRGDSWADDRSSPHYDLESGYGTAYGDSGSHSPLQSEPSSSSQGGPDPLHRAPHAPPPSGLDAGHPARSNDGGEQ